MIALRYIAALGFCSLLMPMQSAYSRGLAVAQAPEAGIGICFGSDAIEMIECARAACSEQSGLPEEFCEPQIWCANANWAADIFIQHEQGPHWHEYLCGWSSYDTLIEAVKLKCDSPSWLVCEAVAIWNPEGEAVELAADWS